MGVDNSCIINNTPHNTMVIAPLIEDKVTSNKEVDLIIEEITKEVGAIIKMIKDSFRGRGYGRGRGFDQNQDNYRSDFQCGRGQGNFCRPWRAHGNYSRGHGFTPAGTGDPQYKGISQYKYICGICHSRGHYDHQCHTLQHLFHAVQQQSGQQMAQPTTEYDNTNPTNQSAF